MSIAHPCPAPPISRKPLAGKGWLSLVSIASALLLSLAPPASADDALSLAGEWAFRLDPDNRGIDQHWETQNFPETVRLPGSLDENAKGTPNATAHRSYLSRLFEYVGPAWYRREVEVPAEWAGHPLQLFLERCHWETQLWVDDRPLRLRDSLCTPHVYDLGTIEPGKHRIVLRIDNSIKYDVGTRAHSVTEHTQTNWNGVVGRMELRALQPVRLDSVQVFPDAATRSAVVRVTTYNSLSTDAAARIVATALGASASADVKVPWGACNIAELRLDLGPGAPLWDEFDPRLIDLEVRLDAQAGDARCSGVERVRFGLRDIRYNGTQFTLNGRPYMVRGTLECCIFPLTGYPATDVATWRRMMETARQYGLNHLRFHSWCPPDAAFTAADETGFTLQIETPVWTDVGSHADVDEFIRHEADRILEAYGNHPSFAMLAVGNEPSGPNKDKFLTGIVQSWQAKDPRRLYTTCAGWPELPVSDFHIVHERDRKPYRLHGGHLAPDTDFDYRDVLVGTARPAIAHELGQWCVYPDYREIPKYTGVLRARNLEGFRDSLRRNGRLFEQVHDFAWASGRLQRLMYKADIEALLRTPGAGGFQLLALQDFPGQGSALEGFLDAFWDSKGTVTPDEFRRFCSETVPLVRLQKFTWTTGETLAARAEIAHFGAAPLLRARPCWSVRTADGRELASGNWGERDVPLGSGTALGEIALPLADVPAPQKLTLSVYLAGLNVRNEWDVWVYPAGAGTGDLGRVRIAHEWSDDVAEALRNGADVLLLPKDIAPLRRVNSAFEPIFWNTQWFPGQDRQLGILCDPRHPAFAQFPNDGHTDWQWWDLLNKSTVMRLDPLNPGFRPLVQVVDDWNKNRILGAVFDGRLDTGRLLVCTLDIENNLESRPAAAALRRSLLAYMNSDKFAPSGIFNARWLAQAFAPGETVVAQVEADHTAPGSAPENAVDGNPDTIWYTPDTQDGPGYPHEVRILFKSDLTLSGLRYTPRRDAPNGRIGRCAVYIAADGRNWAPPVAEQLVPVGPGPHEIRFSQPVKTRWLRFVALEGDETASIAELEPIRVE